jgi:hypothetical protein
VDLSFWGGRLKARPFKRGSKTEKGMISYGLSKYRKNKDRHAEKDPSLIFLLSFLSAFEGFALLLILLTTNN